MNDFLELLKFLHEYEVLEMNIKFVNENSLLEQKKLLNGYEVLKSLIKMLNENRFLHRYIKLLNENKFLYRKQLHEYKSCIGIKMLKMNVHFVKS